jgi:hypothetical protein
MYYLGQTHTNKERGVLGDSSPNSLYPTIKNCFLEKNNISLYWYFVIGFVWLRI